MVKVNPGGVEVYSLEGDGDAVLTSALSSELVRVQRAVARHLQHTYDATVKKVRGRVAGRVGKVGRWKGGGRVVVEWEGGRVVGGSERGKEAGQRKSEVGRKEVREEEKQAGKEGREGERDGREEEK